MKIDVIIPLYKPDSTLFLLLDRLENQTVPVGRIILMNTGKKYFEELTAGTDFPEKYGNVQVVHLEKEEFDHGGTRHRGVMYSQADIFVVLTQDAMPADVGLLERLTENLSGNVAVAYARQLTGPASSILEKASRHFNYPEVSRIKTKADLEELGIKTYFCSNVCAAYRRDIYEELGGFIRHTIFNEDMIYAAAAIAAGYAVSYEAEAQVIHSHNYTNFQQLRRNFDLGVSQADHPEIFAEVASESEGKKLVKGTWRYLKRRKQLYRFPGFCVQCGFKYAGYLLGKHYKKLPMGWVLKLTASREYWRQKEN
ncbi:glycosyltransferase family 2 protein [Acetatifactor muris]|uniref:glycosyltransferase family 2 protein n=1 Tax=Acetatifactor muris TaxID=879566 RepID=UPI0023F39AC3|nr:glycosyltransferase [Acetatifactor muris]